MTTSTPSPRASPSERTAQRFARRCSPPSFCHASTEGGAFGAARARQYRDQIRNEFQALEQRHSEFVTGLAPGERDRIQDRLRDMDRIRERTRDRLREMDAECDKAAPDRKRLRKQARDVEREMTRLRTQYRDLEVE